MSVFRPANILIPKNVDLKKWSVVACDQYTSEPEYWKAVENEVGASPSTLKLIFPEIYLEDIDAENRIKSINNEMQSCIDNDVFKVLEKSLIYVERDLGNGKVRKGIVGEVDLEEYDFGRSASSYIRATEGTVLDRIPPRVKIRENAKLELPHIMLLIDDPDRIVIESIRGMKDSFEKIYDFELMQNSGRLVGYKLSKDAISLVDRAIERLSDSKEFSKRYGIKDRGVLVFAVGDGNHSLATAKTCWEKIKTNLTEEEREFHPARFALVEVVNVYDESLEFEPIHRVVFDVNSENLIKEFMKFYKDVSHIDNGGQHIRYSYKDKTGDLYIRNPVGNLAVATLQVFLDDYMSKHGGKLDYIHGDDVVSRLSKQDNSIGFYLPAMNKSELFRTIIIDGVLPRKTFSMGEAKEKRFYFECKKI